MITREGVKPFPPTGYRTLDARTSFFYGVTGITPAMAMRVTGIGSQYLFAIAGCRQELLRRRQDLQGDAAQGHSGGELLVVHALRQPDALDARHAAALPARRQPELSLARRRSRAPTAPRRSTSARRSLTASKRGNWIQTDAEQGLVRDPAPLQPARAVLHQGVAAERDRVGEVTSRSLSANDNQPEGIMKTKLIATALWPRTGRGHPAARRRNPGARSPRRTKSRPASARWNTRTAHRAKRPSRRPTTTST